jgi:hypothetical protein
MITQHSAGDTSWLVLGSPNDASAVWAFESLKALGRCETRFVHAAALGPAARWDHWISNSSTGVIAGLSDGATLRSSATRGVLNRLGGNPGWRFPKTVSSRDASYAQVEIAAFFLSWLSSFSCNIINRPTPRSLAGRTRGTAEWCFLAGQVGLPTRSLRGHSQQLTQEEHVIETAGSLLVLDEEVFGEAPESICSASRQMQVLSGSRLLGITFTRDHGLDWEFDQATVQPDLRVGGSAFIQALVRAFDKPIGKGS